MRSTNTRERRLNHLKTTGVTLIATATLSVCLYMIGLPLDATLTAALAGGLFVGLTRTSGKGTLSHLTAPDHTRG